MWKLCWFEEFPPACRYCAGWCSASACGNCAGCRRSPGFESFPDCDSCPRCGRCAGCAVGDDFAFCRNRAGCWSFAGLTFVLIRLGRCGSCSC